MKKIENILAVLGLFLLMTPMFVACSDEPDSDQFRRTHQGEMLSTYLKTRSQYSMFSEIVDRAGLSSMLSSYGAYTCFAPNNDAIEEYLGDMGLSSLSDLTDADCDTLARTHLLSILLTSFNIHDGVMTHPNMNNYYLSVSHNAYGNDSSVIFLEGDTHVIYALQDDSVENGIVHPVDRVIRPSNGRLVDIFNDNPDVKIYNEALIATGLVKKLEVYKDEDYKQEMNDAGTDPKWYRYTTGDNLQESARSPEFRLIGFTAFVVPDSVLKKKYGVTSLNGEKNSLVQLAKSIYDPIFPDDADVDDVTDSRNSLYRFMAYHLLNRNVKGYNLLTIVDDLGLDKNKINPTEWYYTMFNQTMVKVEKLTVSKYIMGGDVRNDIYLNRRVDGQSMVPGVHVQKEVAGGYRNTCNNGVYFYIDDILKYDKTVTEDVMNCRIRMDMSTVFPELMTNGIRMNYNPETNALVTANPGYQACESETYGTCYYFPQGYLDGVTLGSADTKLIYRFPRLGFYSYCGDEFICQGNFDVSFRIPPVPTEGDYQIRLGYAAMSIRGIAQVYFDNKPQGIPLDMRRDLTHETVLGSKYWADHSKYDDMTDEEKSAEMKDLKNKGFYRGANSAWNSWTKGATSGTFESDMAATLRQVLCTVHIKPFEDHYLRFRCVSEGLGNNEIMLDYLEIVPKSVYGVVDDGMQEDPY